MTCKDCIHCEACEGTYRYYDDEYINEVSFSGDVRDLCTIFKNKADFAEVDKFSEQIIRKQAEVSDYWKKDVVSYRTMQGYSNIEHDTDNFLRGYNEAVEDMLAILGERRDS